MDIKTYDDAGTGPRIVVHLHGGVPAESLAQIFTDAGFEVTRTGATDRVRTEIADRVRRELPDLLSPELADLDVLPLATIEQAKRKVALQQQLLTTWGAVSFEELAAARGKSVDTTRQSVLRARRRHQLFTVEYKDTTLLPGFLLDEDLQPRKAFTGAIQALTPTGESGWALWAWFCLPSAWLGGRVPVDVAEVDDAAVTEAARRRASNA